MYLPKIKDVFDHGISGNRVILIFSSDDMTILLAFLSSSKEEDKKILNWIFESSYDDNRIEIKEIASIH